MGASDCRCQLAGGTRRTHVMGRDRQPKKFVALGEQLHPLALGATGGPVAQIRGCCPGVLARTEMPLPIRAGRDPAPLVGGPGGGRQADSQPGRRAAAAAIVAARFPKLLNDIGLPLQDRSWFMPRDRPRVENVDARPHQPLGLSFQLMFPLRRCCISKRRSSHRGGRSAPRLPPPGGCCPPQG
jgi:hypothetical protein